MNDVVVGCGEVGSALVHVLEMAGRHVFRWDPYKNLAEEPDGPVDVLNLCFPYSKDFVKQAKEYIKQFDPRLTIIHSTVKPGTTRKIGRKVAYSFVRGRHQDDMAPQMLIHTKHVGCAAELRLTWATEYLESLGFEVDPYIVPEAVEYGKLMDTTYYGICIAATKMFKEHADKLGIPWEALAEINRAYNIGSIAVGHPEWVRPELYPVPGPIGGHCVVTNTNILQEDFSHKLLDAIIEAK